MPRSSLFRNSSLTASQLEMIALYVSALNSCDHCRTMHSAEMDGRGESRLAAALKAQDLAGAPVTPAERLLLEFAGTLTRHAYRVTDKTVEGLRAAGWTDEQIGEAAFVAAFMNMVVRVVDGIGFRPRQIDHHP